jgi:hypothetical protein
MITGEVLTERISNDAEALPEAAVLSLAKPIDYGH